MVSAAVSSLGKTSLYIIECYETAHSDQKAPNGGQSATHRAATPQDNTALYIIKCYETGHSDQKASKGGHMRIQHFT